MTSAEIEFQEMAARAFQALPQQFREAASDVVIRIADWPEGEALRHFGIRSAFGLLGLYHGVALPYKTTLDTPQDTDMVTLYRIPIISYARETGEALEDVVRHVLIHELGHHFGFSDADMTAIEAADA